MQENSAVKEYLLLKNSIIEYKNKIQRLERLINKISDRKSLFDHNHIYVSNLQLATEIYMRYNSSIFSRMLKVLPFIRKKYLTAKDNYNEALKYFKEAYNLLNISSSDKSTIDDCIKRFYTKMDMVNRYMQNIVPILKKNLESIKNKEAQLERDLKQSKHRVFQQTLDGLPENLAIIASKLPWKIVYDMRILLEEQKINLDDLTLDKFNEFINNLYTKYNCKLEELKTEKERLNTRSKELEKIQPYVANYKRLYPYLDQLPLQQKRELKRAILAMNSCGITKAPREQTFTKEQILVLKKKEKTQQKIEVLNDKITSINSIRQKLSDINIALIKNSIDISERTISVAN